MVKNPILVSSILVWFLASGCGANDEHPLNHSMKRLSAALHARDMMALTEVLSNQTTDALTEAFNVLTEVHKSSKALPESERQALVKGLPKSVITGNKAEFLLDLANQRLSTLRLNPQTAFGLEIDDIQQENDTSALVITNSGQRLTFTREDKVWKVHLFKAPLAKLLTDARQLQQAITLTIDRTKRRKQIKTVLESVKRKNK